MNHRASSTHVEQHVVRRGETRQREVRSLKKNPGSCLDAFTTHSRPVPATSGPGASICGEPAG